MINPDGLDRQGWEQLLNAPVGGWPASNIIHCADADERLAMAIPVDVVGMITDINPNGLYRKGEELDMRRDARIARGEMDAHGVALT